MVLYHKKNIFLCGAICHVSDRCKENTNSTLAQATLYCQTSFYYKRVSCVATDTEGPLDLLASKNIAYISCIPASPKIQPFTILPQLPSPLNFIIENLKFLSELQEHSKATRK